MPKIQKLRVLTIDNQRVLVQDMSPEVQELVSIYNEWNQDLSVARTKAAQLTAAVAVAHDQISNQIKQEWAAKAEAEAKASEVVEAKAATEAAEAKIAADQVHASAGLVDATVAKHDPHVTAKLAVLKEAARVEANKEYADVGTADIFPGITPIHPE